jgi:hypothetical protein
MPRALARGALRWLPVLACAALVAAHVEVWASRAAYPFDLEWMEGGMLAHAWRLERGLPLYVRPGPEFVPYVYPPGYPAIVAALGSAFGLSPLLGRLVSLAGVALAASGAAFGVARGTGSGRAAVFAATAAVATYHHAGAFYDLVRPDALFLGLLAWSAALAAERGRATAVSAGLLLAAAFTVKHNAAAWGLPFALAIAWRDGWRRAVGFGLAAALPAGLLALRWELASDGLFTTYLLRVPASHPSMTDRWWPGLGREVGNALPIPLAVVLARCWKRAADQPVHPALSVFAPAAAGMLVGWAGTYVKPPPESGLYNVPASVGFFALGMLPVALTTWLAGGHRRGEAALPLLLGGATLGITGAMRAHNGGYVNVLAPLFLLIVVAAAREVGALARRGHDGLAAAVVLLHVAWIGGTFERRAIRPTARDREAGERLVEACRAVDGPVLSPFAAWLPTYAGKPPSLHYMGAWDLDYAGNPLRGDLAAIEGAVRDHWWALALGGNQRFGFGLQEAYPREEVVLDPKTRALLPKTGWPARPTRLLRPPR